MVLNFNRYQSTTTKRYRRKISDKNHLLHKYTLAIL